MEGFRSINKKQFSTFTPFFPAFCQSIFIFLKKEYRKQ